MQVQRPPSKATAQLVSCNHVSCNRHKPEISRSLLDSGFAIERVTPVDMFPHTKHVGDGSIWSKLDVDKNIDVKIKLDELDLTSAESKRSVHKIKERT